MPKGNWRDIESRGRGRINPFNATKEPSGGGGAVSIDSELDLFNELTFRLNNVLPELWRNLKEGELLSLLGFGGSIEIAKGGQILGLQSGSSRDARLLQQKGISQHRYCPRPLRQPGRSKDVSGTNGKRWVREGYGGEVQKTEWREDHGVADRPCLAE